MTGNEFRDNIGRRVHVRYSLGQTDYLVNGIAKHLEWHNEAQVGVIEYDTYAYPCDLEPSVTNIAARELVVPLAYVHEGWV